MGQIYNDPAGGQNSSIGGTQFNTYKYQKLALIEAQKEQYFMQLADTISMPKHFGKTIKRHLYLPMLHDANVNDQGIDAAGLSTTVKKTIAISLPDSAVGNSWTTLYAVGEGANNAAATTAAEAKANDIFKNNGVFTTNYATSKAAVLALTPAWTVDETIAVVPNTGNLYGSSKDVGTITGKLPLLSENGGYVNRVGFTRVDLEGSISKYGFYDSYTQESMDFDTDEQLGMHINREMMRGASEITEDMLQIDLLNSAGVVRFGGSATSTGQLTAEGTPSVLSYNDFMRMAIDLDKNRTPKNTKIITGTRLVDTRVVQAARYMYVGTEVVPMLKTMVDNFSNQAFISVEKYAANGTVARGEIGQVDQFKIIVVPEMMHWEGAGAAVAANPGYYESNGNYDVFPLLVVGDASFTTIGFQTNGKTVKFKIKHSKPGSPESYANDPYGETGFMSIKWYYGFMVLRPERIALAKVVAKW